MSKNQNKTIKEEIEEIADTYEKRSRIQTYYLLMGVIRKTLQRFIEKTIGEMYRNAVLSDKYPDLAKESKIKFETKQEIEKKMKQWLKDNLN